MSAFVPNAVLSVFPNLADTEGTDDWGYPVDNPNPDVSIAAKTGIYALITQGSGVSSMAGQTVNDPGTGNVTVVTKFVIRCRPGAWDFQPDDRVRDERTGLIYQVNNVKANAGVVQQADIVLSCKRVN